MRAILRALSGAVIGAVVGVALCALVGAIWFEIGALSSPNADSRPSDAWLMGAIWIGIGFGLYAAPAGAVVGLLVGLLVGWASDARRDPGSEA